MMHIISLGAGVQSSTMALMAAHGEITPMPDCAIFADTQAEPQAVYRWLDWLEKQLPFTVHRETAGDLGAATLKVHRSKRGVLYQRTLVPFFIKKADGSRGMLRRECTSEYKIRVLTKKQRQLLPIGTMRAWRKAHSEAYVAWRTAKKNKAPIPRWAWLELQDNALVECWIGISTDESSRMKPSSEPWIRHRWPLIERGASRSYCLSWMKARGNPQPPRSACRFCPYHSDAEWIRLRDTEPEEFRLAVAWEREAQASNEHDEVTRGKLFLHDSLLPLDQVKFDETQRPEQLSMFDNECEGMCGV